MSGGKMGLFGKPKTIVLGVEGMTCGHCVMRVTKALTGLKGVKEAKVELEAKKATVTYDPSKVDEKAMIAAIVEAGYQAKVIG
jgi:copper chaperone